MDIPWVRLLALGFKTSLGWELVESSFDDWVTKVNIYLFCALMYHSRHL